MIEFHNKGCPNPQFEYAGLVDSKPSNKCKTCGFIIPLDKMKSHVESPAMCVDPTCPMCRPQADKINPLHYKSHPSGVECIQITEHQNFCIGNAIKYLWRSDLKNGLEDLKKAAWYIDREIKKREKEIKK